MSATVEVAPGVRVPLKCDDRGGVEAERNSCTEPGSLLRCTLCPASPNYWRKAVAE